MNRVLISSFLFAFLVLTFPIVISAAADEPDPEPRPIAVRQAHAPELASSDEAAMVLVGTALIGIAAALRRAA